MPAPPAPETQLLKPPPAGDGSAPLEPNPPVPAAMLRREVPSEARLSAPTAVVASNGAAANGATTNGATTNGAAAHGEPRPKLHLSLGNGNGAHSATNGNGNGHSHDAPARPTFLLPRAPQAAPAATNGERPFQAPRGAGSFDAARNGRDLFTVPEGRPAAQTPRDTDAARKENGAFIDRELRSRVDGDIAAFLAAFDAALAADTHESRFGLREATDRLLRAGARTRIELERLEARVPLPRPEGAAPADPAAWRYR